MSPRKAIIFWRFMVGESASRWDVEMMAWTPTCHFCSGKNLPGISTAGFGFLN
jgi:hypothetical protein